MKPSFVLVLIAVANIGWADIISWNNRSTFESAAPALTTEDFESFTIDTPFFAATVDVGDFEVSTIGTLDNTLNIIDVPPARTSETDVNGSVDLRIQTRGNVGGPSHLVLTFDTPINYFGADFRNINDSIVRTRMLLDADIVDMPMAPSLSFFGVFSDVAFSTVTLEGLSIDSFGVDNLAYAAIPEPSSMLLFAFGFAGLAVARRKGAGTLAKEG